MKKLLFILLFVLPIAAFGQKIGKSEIDDFTGEKVIYTSWEKIKGGNGMTGKNNFIFRFRYENNATYLHLKWVTAEILSIKEEAKLIFKMNDGATVEVTALSFVISSKGAGATGLSMSSIEGIDPIYIGNFTAFSTKNYATKFRIYTSKGYVDIDLKEKDALKINTAYQLLQTELNK